MGNTLSFDILGNDKASKAFQNVGKSVDAAGDKLENLSKSGEKVARSADQAADKLGKIKSPPAVEIDAKDNASDKIDRVARQKPPAVTVPVEAEIKGDVKSKLKEVGGAGGQAFAGGFLGSLAGGDLLGAAADIVSNAMDQATSKRKLNIDIQNQMGITPEGARQYGERIGAAYGAGLGDSKDQIKDVYTTLSSDVQGWSTMTISAQDKIARNQTKIVQGFGVEVGESIQAASSAVANKLVPTWQDAQDLLVTGYQTLGSRGDDWADTLQEYSGYFRQLGIDGPQALGLIKQGLDAGARDTDYVADLWKEVGIRIIDTSKSTKDALKDLFKGTKTDIDDLQRTIAAGGPPAEAALEKVITRLQGIKDPVEKNRIGVNLFGTQYEDTFRRVVESTDMAKAKLTQFQGATENLATATQSATERLSRWWDEASGNVAEAASQMIFSAFDTGNALSFLTGKTTEETYKLGVSLDGTNRGFQALADTVGGYASPRFIDMVTKMTDSQLAAYGVERKLDDLGHVVLNMPEGKPIVIDTNAGRVISDLGIVKSRVDALPTGPKFFTYFIDTVVRGPGPGSLNTLNQVLGGHAEGGWVRGPGSSTSDSIPRMLSDGEFVVNAAAASKNRTLLEAVNAGRGFAGAAPSGGMAPYGRASGQAQPQKVIVEFQGDFWDSIKRYVKVTAGGNVQKAFGQ